MGHFPAIAMHFRFFPPGWWILPVSPACLHLRLVLESRKVRRFSPEVFIASWFRVPYGTHPPVVVEQMAIYMGAISHGASLGSWALAPGVPITYPTRLEDVSSLECIYTWTTGPPLRRCRAGGSWEMKVLGELQISPSRLNHEKSTFQWFLGV